MNIGKIIDNRFEVAVNSIMYSPFCGYTRLLSVIQLPDKPGEYLIETINMQGERHLFDFEGKHIHIDTQLTPSSTSSLYFVTKDYEISCDWNDYNYYQLLYPTDDENAMAKSQNYVDKSTLN